MITIFIISTKMAALAILKKTKFSNKGYGVIIFVHDVAIKFYHVTQITLQMWPCDQSLVTVARL